MYAVAEYVVTGYAVAKNPLLPIAALARTRRRPPQNMCEHPLWQ